MKLNIIFSAGRRARVCVREHVCMCPHIENILPPRIGVPLTSLIPQKTTPFMVLSVTYIVYEGAKLDAQRSQSVRSANCQYDTIYQHK